MEIENT